LDGKTVVLEPTLVVPTSTVRVLKGVIEAQEGILPQDQRLIYGGCQLDDDDLTLEEYEIDEDATIELSLRLLGGGKKRKKKVYSTPKKIKHKRKKVKLAVLKLYKIGDNDKIDRNRVECPSATCGGGVFMAKHTNRHYCGRCHNTVTEQK
jgi:small subunit ribosomal protein S27Ae